MPVHATETIKQYKHQSHQHCESGNIANLLQFHNIHLTEPLAFGIGAGLYFAYTPWAKIMEQPFITFRYFPGTIFKTVAKNLGISYEMKTFGNSTKAQESLDQLLSNKIPVGLVTNMFQLTYMPEMFRIPFNFHNLIVLQKEDNKYKISDNILEVETFLDQETLNKARFDKGSMTNPKGKLYWIKESKSNFDLKEAIYKGMQITAKRMLSKWNPFAGIVSMKKLANKIKTYPKKHTHEEGALLLLHIVRLQEILGTGGAGFRAIYTKFLEQAAAITNSQALEKLGKEMNNIANDWRNFALQAAKCAKKNNPNIPASYEQVGNMLLEIAQKETSFFEQLKKIKL